MSVRYKTQKIRMKSSKAYGKYYGRPVSLGHISTEKLAQEIAHSSSVTKADILAVLAELSHAMKAHLQNSMTVDLDGIGSFRVGFCSTPTDDEKSFTVGNIKRFQIYYAPAKTPEQGFSPFLSSIKEIIRIFAQFINYRRYGEHYQKG